ncbi:MAG: glycoside hydrolase family 31 protein [Anaerolineales bacterium]|nr:glycoside hydrolase family 31 protein [Anaerolineales bacterium]
MGVRRTDVEPHIREALKLRQRLMPYWYTLAWQACRDGAPIVRPLFWVDPEDEALREIEDAFMLGEHLLVAPVLESGRTVREVQLPRGRWFDLYGDGEYEGPGRLTLFAPLERCPVLVRAGSVLPVENEGKLTLEIFAPQTDSGTGLLYSDAGDGYGPHRLDRFMLNRERDTLEISWEKEGGFPFPYDTIQLSVHGFAITSANVDGETVELEAHTIQVSPFDCVRMESK